MNIATVERLGRTHPVSVLGRLLGLADYISWAALAAGMEEEPPCRDISENMLTGYLPAVPGTLVQLRRAVEHSIDYAPAKVRTNLHDVLNEVLRDLTECDLHAMMNSDPLRNPDLILVVEAQKKALMDA